MPTTISKYESSNNGLQYTTSFSSESPYVSHKKRSGLKFYLKCIKWLWNNRDWANTRQKFKAMDKECNL